MPRRLGMLLGALALVGGGCAFGGNTESTAGSAPTEVLLISPLGEPVPVPTNTLPAGLLPPPRMGLRSQVPTPARGGIVPEPVRDRLESARTGQDEFVWFPAHPPSLASYLASQDAIGNTALKPGPLLPPTVLDEGVQKLKFEASSIGLRYSLSQSLTWVTLSDALHGADDFGFYTLSWHGKWAVYDDPAGGTAGWVSSKVGAKTGLGDAGDTQSAARALGSAVDPTGIWSKVNGFRIPELAWQQSLAGGEVVAVAGMVNQSDYFDANSYANTGRGQFINSALINSMVLPMPGYNFGLNLQWQPGSQWYAMLGGSVGHGRAGAPPWTGFAWDNWSALGEVGFAPADVFGLGPGVYRVQPFLGQVNGATAEAGFGLNFQQQLGSKSPFGWFGRYGRGGTERWLAAAESTSGHTGSQVGTGFVMGGPLHHVGLLPGRVHDAAGIGFVWSHPDLETKAVQHVDEYAVEVGYVVQLTPTARLQPDFQVVWNRAYNPDPDPATVFQIQLDLGW